MKSRLVLSAFLRLRNIGLLLVFLATAAIISDASAMTSAMTIFGTNGALVPGVFAFPAAFAAYLCFVMQALASKNFHEQFNKKEKVRKIQDLNYISQRLSNEARRNTNSMYLQKLKKVMDDKNDIVDNFFKGEKSFIKERITEQTLNLVVSYLKLLNNFCIRSRELSTVDVGSVAARINTNARKLSFAKDSRMAEDIRKIIDMDERLINRLKQERKDLEHISAKLDYMESTVNMFKHQTLTSEESEDMLEKLETAVNEAEALDNVLEDRRKSRTKNR